MPCTDTSHTGTLREVQRHGNGVARASVLLQRNLLPTCKEQRSSAWISGTAWAVRDPGVRATGKVGMTTLRKCSPPGSSGDGLLREVRFLPFTSRTAKFKFRGPGQLSFGYCSRSGYDPSANTKGKQAKQLDCQTLPFLSRA